MAQPTGQVNLAAGNASEYFWYAQGTGLWNAKAGASESKTGTGAVAAEAGANVIQTAGTTYFTLGSALVLSGLFTIGFKVRATAANNASMVFGNRNSNFDFLWLNNGSNLLQVRANNGTIQRAYAASAALKTIHIVRFDINTAPLLYVDGVLDGSFNQAIPSTFTIAHILAGYSGGSYSLNGVLEYLNVLDGVALNATQIASRASDPYQILAAGTSDITASGGAVASGTATGSMSAPAGNISASGGAVASGTATGTMSAAGSGTITIPAVRDWSTGNLKAGASGVQVDIHSISTGALVVRKTGQTTHGTTGVCTVTDALIAPGTTYEVVTRFADGSLGVWDYAAT